MLTAEQIERIYKVTDQFQLDRDAVVVPLAAAGAPKELIFPDGKLLVRAPGGDTFETWISDLRRRLEWLDLSRTPRADKPKR